MNKDKLKSLVKMKLELEVIGHFILNDLILKCFILLRI